MDLPDRPKRSNVFMDANLEAEGQTSDIEVVRIRDISAGRCRGWRRTSARASF